MRFERSEHPLPLLSNAELIAHLVVLDVLWSVAFVGADGSAEGGDGLHVGRGGTGPVVTELADGDVERVTRGEHGCVGISRDVAESVGGGGIGGG